LAVGARVSLHAESATEDPLPGELDVASSDPGIISAHMGLEPASVELSAHNAGACNIEILSEGEQIDSLPFDAAPAGIVKHSAASRAFAGGALDILVTDVFGDCGEDDECRLLGHSFLAWRVDPPELGAFLVDFDHVASFRMTSAGSAELVGNEVTRNRDLVTQAVEVVATTAAASLSATLRTVPFDPDEQGFDVVLPGSLARPDAFSVRVEAVLMDGSSVPVSRRDVVWTISGAVVEAPTADSRDPLVTLFVPGADGLVTLSASVPILMLEQSFDLELTPP
jgi:hypothetical protein